MLLEYKEDSRYLFILVEKEKFPHVQRTCRSLSSSRSLLFQTQPYLRVLQTQKAITSLHNSINRNLTLASSPFLVSGTTSVSEFCIVFNFCFVHRNLNYRRLMMFSGANCLLFLSSWFSSNSNSVFVSLYFMIVILLLMIVLITLMVCIIHVCNWIWFYVLFWGFCRNSVFGLLFMILMFSIWLEMYDVVKQLVGFDDKFDLELLRFNI